MSTRMSTGSHRSPCMLRLAVAAAAVLLCASTVRAQPPTSPGSSAVPSAGGPASRVDPAQLQRLQREASAGAGTVLIATVLAKQLMTRDVVGLPGKEVVVTTIEYPPGASSPPHRHDAQVFVYVLQGRVIMQVKGGPRMTLGPGQMFYENPSDIHVVSANASKTRPARFLAFLIKDKGKPGTLPVTPDQAQ